MNKVEHKYEYVLKPIKLGIGNRSINKQQKIIMMAQRERTEVAKIIWLNSIDYPEEVPDLNFLSSWFTIPSWSLKCI